MLRNRCGRQCPGVKAAAPNGAGDNERLQEIASAAPSLIADFCNKICQKRKRNHPRADLQSSLIVAKIE
jgi:hypothetical protein